jgi:hypothetical protein
VDAGDVDAVALVVLGLVDVARGQWGPVGAEVLVDELLLALLGDPCCGC